jgi:hypothetical protein
MFLSLKVVNSVHTNGWALVERTFITVHGSASMIRLEESLDSGVIFIPDFVQHRRVVTFSLVISWMGDCLGLPVAIEFLVHSVALKQAIFITFLFPLSLWAWNRASVPTIPAVGLLATPRAT